MEKNPPPSRKRPVACPYCAGGGRMVFANASGDAMYAKCPLCRGRGRFPADSLLLGLARLASRFATTHFEFRYVRRAGHRADGHQRVRTAFGLERAKVLSGRKAGAPGRIPVRRPQYRKWLRKRMAREGLRDGWSGQAAGRLRIGKGKAFAIWDRRRR